MIRSGHPFTTSTTDLGKFIREHRLALELSQGDISVPECGLTQASISLFEIGKRKSLSSEQMISLSVVLTCDMEELRKFARKSPVLEPVTKLNKFIHDRRVELGLTYSQIADRLGIPISQARYLEIRGYERLKYSRLHSVAKALELDVSALSEFVDPDNNEPSTDLGKLLRGRRKELGLRLKIVADKAGITRQRLNQIELGRCTMESKETMNLLATALNLEISQLEAVKPKRKFKEITASSPLGDFFSKKRLELKISREGLGALAEMSSHSILRIEMSSPVKWKTVQKLAKALKCEIPPELIPKWEIDSNMNTTAAL